MEQVEFRRVERVKLDIPISLILSGCESPCTLVNISILGVGVSGTKYIDMHMGQKVVVMLPGVGKVAGEIRWHLAIGALGYTTQCLCQFSATETSGIICEI